MGASTRHVVLPSRVAWLAREKVPRLARRGEKQRTLS